MKKITLFSYLLIYGFLSWSQTNNTINSPTNTQKIITYFSRPVNNAVSSGTNAIYLNDLIDDTLIAYINRAKYTLDMAIYSFNESEISSISTAINNAYTRGVSIRWIYNGEGSSNPSLPLLNGNIHTLASPSSIDYGIMHNKFMIIDANSANTDEPIVWTGSTNWTAAQINTDANNVIIIQDQAMALAYTTEFNEMWGSSGLVPNLTNSRFGQFKADNTPHSFNVDGTMVEVYFSPTDGTNAKLQHAIRSANIDLYFGIYSFTVASIADSIVERIQHSVYAAGIMDATSNGYSPKVILPPVMGTNLITDHLTGLYHNKMLIVDPSAPTSDPLVFTGSHNWSASANTKNDENTVIVHNASIANIYYQSFYQNFIDEGGTLIGQSIIPFNSATSTITVYPNPCNDYTIIKINEPSTINNTEIAFYNSIGEEIYPYISKNSDSFIISTKQLPQGLYFIQIKAFNTISFKKLQIIR